MVDVYLENLTYSRTEINEINSTETIRVNTELDTKTNNASIGSPSGVATLDSGGTHPAVEIPFATNAEAYTGTEVDIIINPSNLAYVLSFYQSQIDALEARIVILEGV